MNLRKSPAPPKPKPPKPKPTSLARNSATIGLIFMSPWIIGFVLFKLIPILAALGFSFTNFRMLEPDQTQFIGLKNYLEILGDQGAGASIFGSIGSFLFIVPIQMISALALAVIASSARLRNKLLLRTLFFLPSVIPAIAILSIMSGLADPRTGWINQLILDPLNLPSSSPRDIFPVVLALWSIGPTFIIMLSAIQSIPAEIIEAARVDGAGPILRLFAIVLPMISPAIFFSLVINMTNAFGGVVLLDRGMPFNRSLSPMESYITHQMFSLGRLGYASALAWVMFLMVMLVIVVLFRSARYWVYFPQEGDNEEI
ncbi:MAG: sugar ABC transporter permease [Anaerolineales bacterium]